MGGGILKDLSVLFVCQHERNQSNDVGGKSGSLEARGPGHVSPNSRSNFVVQRAESRAMKEKYGS